MIYDDMNIHYNYTMKKNWKVGLSSNKHCIHLTMTMSLLFFLLKMLWYFPWNWAKQSSLQGWVLGTSVSSLFHCLCGCWCKGINLWPHQILAWMIVVHLFEQHRTELVCSAILVTHETELGDHDFCLSWSHYTDIIIYITFIFIYKRPRDLSLSL